MVRNGDWKYLYFYSDRRSELYNLKDDIGETKNLVALNPKKAKKMKTKLTSVLKAHDATIPLAVPPKTNRLNKKR